jgi:hypothetical protein
VSSDQEWHERIFTASHPKLLTSLTTVAVGIPAAEAAVQGWRRLTVPLRRRLLSAVRLLVPLLGLTITLLGLAVALRGPAMSLMGA